MISILDSIVPMAAIVFELSIKSSLLVLFIIIIRRIFRFKLPYQWQFVFWFVIVFRLLLPFDMTTHSSLFSIFNINNSYVSEHETVSPEIQNLEVKYNEIPENSTYLDPNNLPEYPEKSSLSLVHFLVLLWALGMIVFSILIYRTNRKVLKKIRGKSLVKDEHLQKLFKYCKDKMQITSNIKLCEMKDIKIPFIVGLIKPQIIIPENARSNFKPKQLTHIFLHELAHHKRYDIISSWLITILNIIHWFNPVIWLAFYLMRLDREIACDGLALRYIKWQRHNEYGRSILTVMENFSKNYSIPLSVGLISNKFELSRRLKMIAHNGNYRKKWMVPFICCFVSLNIFAFTKYSPDLPIDDDKPATYEKIDLSKFIVAIDPGHGGKDHGGGNIAIDSTKEKDITLAITNKLYTELYKTGINVYQIRTDDAFIPLKQRTAAVDSVGADLAIYFHCNYQKDQTQKGYETYHQDSIMESKILDSLLHKHLNLNTDLVDRKSDTAPFWVLTGTHVPSVLIETGFISNKEDTKNLNDPLFQEKLAIAIKDAVIEYFQNNKKGQPVIKNSDKKIQYNFICPTDSGKVATKFGYIIHPMLKNERRHHDGIDIKAPLGTTVFATADGKIVFAGVKNPGGYGKVIQINHNKGYSTFYAHLNDILVKEGQTVQRGNKIGTVGNTGLSIRPNLHFEIKKDSIAIDPLGLFNSDKLTF